jgi:hypothetical protein
MISKTETYISNSGNELSGYYTCNIDASCSVFHVKKNKEIAIPQTIKTSNAIKTINFKIPKFNIGDKIKITTYLLNNDKYMAVFNMNGQQFFTNSKHPPNVPPELGLKSPILLTSIIVPMENRRKNIMIHM